MNSEATKSNIALNKSILITLTKLFIGLLFIISAVAKLMTLGQFEIIMIEQHIVSDRLTAAYLSRALIALELFIGLCYFQKFYLKKFVLPVTLTVLIGFSIQLIYLILFTDYTENCGCFGELIKMTPLESLFKNLVLIAIVSALLYAVRKKKEEKQKLAIPIFFAVLSVLVVGLGFPVKVITESDIISPEGSEQFADSPLGKNGTSTEPSRFGIFDAIKAGDITANLTEGNCLAAFLSLDCDHCRNTAEELSELSHQIDVRIYFLFLGKEEQVPGFFEETYSNFPYQIVTPSVFFDFIGNAPPRVYSLANGNVLRFWNFKDFSVDEIQDHLNH